MTDRHVIVIGGGLAGLSGAIALAEAGLRVTVYERRATPGGRASSFVHPASGAYVDNCQHVLLRCCTNLIDFYEKLGVRSGIVFKTDIPFIDERNRVSVLYPTRLPAPLHLFPALLRLKTLGWTDKLSIGRIMLSMMRGYGQSIRQDALCFVPISIRAYLDTRHATPRSIDAFWRPFLISALNDDLDDIDADYAIATVVKAFLLNRRGYEVGLPAMPLGDLYAPAAARLERLGGRLTLDTAVSEITLNGDRIASVTLNGGETQTADFYLSAVPFDVLIKWLPDETIERHPYFSRLRGLDVSPITAVHIWFDRPVTDLEYAVVLGRTVQWVFNQSIRGTESSGSYLGLVVSASDGWMKQPQADIVREALDDLRAIFPAAREARVLKTVVVKEGRATFAPKPGCDTLRPGPESPLEGLFVAGDWTRTGWPATMESAVRSGYLSAETILASAGTPQHILRPDLPVDGAMRWIGRKG
ncbi:MAG: FAD-dependent oxidoreductase [candidate division Zixibacteria bacterium]|nr:FAD-dependent oxidoreductase [candidate division Zixibacteria bacterium]